MKTNQICLVLTVIVSCSFIFGLINALKCNVCQGPEDCKSPKKLYCNYVMANKSISYLNYYYSNVPQANTTIFLDCLSDRVQTATGPIEYKGCIYSNFQSCRYTLRPQFDIKSYRACTQCKLDTCNPADRINANRLAVVLIIGVTMFARYL